MYSLYKCLFGSLLCAIGGSEDSTGAGWLAIKEAQGYRRRIRKLRAQVAQKEQDLEVLFVQHIA